MFFKKNKKVTCPECHQETDSSAGNCLKCGAILLSSGYSDESKSYSKTYTLEGTKEDQLSDSPRHKDPEEAIEQIKETITLELSKLGGGRNKYVAAIIAMLIGFLGLHKFYLGETLKGVLYILFFWTGIPILLALIDGVVLLSMSDEEFKARYIDKNFSI